MRIAYLIPIVFLTLLPVTALAQAPAPSPATLRIPRMSAPPDFEDFLDMTPSPATLASMARVDKFVQRWPDDGQPERIRTSAFLGYTSDALHVVFLAFDPDPDALRAHLIRREEVFAVNDDAVELRLDTFGDRRHSYYFVAIPSASSWTRHGRNLKANTTSRSTSSGAAMGSVPSRGSSCG